MLLALWPKGSESAIYLVVPRVHGSGNDSWDLWPDKFYCIHSKTGPAG